MNSRPADVLKHCLAAFWFLCAAAAAQSFDPRDYQAKAEFRLAVDSSKYLKPGASEVVARSAFASLAPGNADRIEVFLFTRPITAASVPDLMNNDAREMRKQSYAALVLFMDKNHRVWQVNLSYVVPGTTVARTIASTPDELRRYFPEMKFENARLRLKGAGSYSEREPDVLRLAWDIDLDLPVKRRMKKTGSASEQIDKRIAELGDWRGEALSRMRKLIHEADPDVVEEWKWRVPVWSHAGIICTGESYKSTVKLTFAKGASLKDPARLFNSSLEGKMRRAIDIREGEQVDAAAFKALVRATVALNTKGR